jgi:hypothetical protein
VECDRIILLGDYFDQFNDTPDHAYNTATWLKEHVLYNPKITALIGNHDQYYIWPWYDYLIGSGFHKMKSDAIRKVLNQEDFDRLKHFTIDQGYVLSHAGLTSQIWKEFKHIEADDFVTTIDSFAKVLEDHIKRNRNMISMNRPAELFMAGWDRGGSVRHGGISWGDWTSFGPVKGINQIVGHTPHVLPEVLVQADTGSIKRYIAHHFIMDESINRDRITSINYALDTHNKHYIIIEDGKVEIYDTDSNLSLREMVKQNIMPAEKDEVEIIESLKEELRRDALAATIGGQTVTVPNMDDIQKAIDKLNAGNAPQWVAVKDEELTD